MKILYKPFAIVAGLIAARLGRKLFNTVWDRFDAGPAPGPEIQQASVAKVIAGKTLEGALMAGVAAAVDRASATSFYHLTGFWPGPKRVEDQEK